MALWLLSCSSSESTESQIEEEAAFVDQGISKYADQNPYNDVWFQAFWWDSFNDSKLEAYPSFYAFLEDQIVALSNAHIDGIWLPPSSEERVWATTPESYLILTPFTEAVPPWNLCFPI